MIKIIATHGSMLPRGIKTVSLYILRQSRIGDVDKLQGEPLQSVDMGRDLHQRIHGVDKDDEELFDSDSFLNNSDGDDSEDDADASSPTSVPANMNSDGALYELSALMDHLPIKRGLSRYYQGKSQSYTSLSAVSSLEDLPKKESPYKRKMMKACKSYAGGLDASQRSPNAPGPCSKTTSKMAPRVASCASLVSKSSSSSVFYSSKPPAIL